MESEIRVKVTLDTAGYQSGFQTIVRDTDSGVSRIVQQATQAATAVGNLGRTYQQNAASFAQAWSSVDQMAGKMAEVAQQYTASGLAFQKASTYFNQGGALQGLVKEFFGLTSRLATQAGTDIKAFGERFSNAIPGITALDQALQHVGLSLGSLGKIAGPAAIFGSMIEGIKAAADFEDAFADVRRQVEFVGDESTTSAEKFDQLAESLRHISSDTGIASKALASVAAEAGHLGLQSVADISKFSETIGKASVVTGLSTKQLSNSFAELAIQMGDTLDHAENMASAVVVLANHSRASESEILSMATTIGGMAKSLGMTTAETLGFSSALASFGAQPMAVNRILGQMRDAARDGGSELHVFAATARMTDRAFQDMVASGHGADALTAFFEGLKKDGDRASVVLDALGLQGPRIQKSFILAANSMGLFNKQISLLRENFNNGREGWENTGKFVEEFNIKMDTLWKQLGKLRNAFEELLITTFGNALGPIKAVTEAMTAFVQTMEEHPALAKTVGLIVELAAAAIGLGLAFRGITAVVGTALTGLGTFFGILEKIAGTAMFGGFVRMWTAFLGLFEGGAIGVITRFGAALAGVGEAIMGGGGLMVALRAIVGVFTGPVGWITLIVSAVSALALLESKTGLVSRAFVAVWDSLKEFGVGIADIWEKDVWPAIEAFAAGVVDIASEIWAPFAEYLGPVFEEIKSLWNNLYEEVILPIAKLIGGAAYLMVEPFVEAYKYVTQRGRDAMAAQEQWVGDATQSALNSQRAMERASEQATRNITKNHTDAAKKIGDGWDGLGKVEQERLKIFDQQQEASMQNQLAISQAVTEGLLSLGLMTETEQIQQQLEGDRVKMIEAEAHKNRMVALARSQAKGGQEAEASAIEAFKKTAASIEADKIKLNMKLMLLDRQYQEQFDKTQVEMAQQVVDLDQAIADQRRKLIEDIANSGYRSDVEQQIKKLRDDRDAAFKEAADAKDKAIPGSAQYAAAVENEALAQERFNKALKDLASAGIEAETRKLQGAVAAIGLTGEEAARATLSFEKFGRAYKDLNKEDKIWVDAQAPFVGAAKEREAALKAIAEAETVTMNAARDSLEFQKAYGDAILAQTIEQEQARLDLRIKTNDTIINAEKNRQQREAVILTQDGQRFGDFGKFVTGTMRKLVADSDDAWTAFGKAAVDVVGQVQRTLSDVLFNYFTTGTFKMADAWKSLMNSMLRTLSDFLAQQAVRAFLALVFGTESGGGLMGGGGGLANAAGSVGAGLVGASGSSGILGGAISSGLGALKSYFGFGSSSSTPSTSSYTGTTSTPSGGGDLFSGSSFGSYSSGGSYNLFGGDYGGGVSSGGYDLFSGSGSSFSTTLDSSFLSDYYFASGGPVPGQGGGDTVPAMLTPGEFVVRAPVAQAMGPLLTALNGGGAPQLSGGRLHFASGGAVPAISGDPAVATLLLALYRQAAMQTMYGQMTAINTGSTAAALGGTAARATGISGTGGNVVPTTTTGGGALVGGSGGAASAIPKFNANFSPSMIPTPPGPPGGSFNLGAAVGNLTPYATFALGQILNGGSSVLSQYSPAQLAGFRTALTKGTFDASQFIDSGQFSASQLVDYSNALFGPNAGNLLTSTGAPQITPDLGTALLSGDTSGFHLIDTHLNDPTQQPAAPGGPSGSTLGILGAGAGTLGGLIGLFQNAQSGSSLGMALSGVTTIASAYSLIQQLLPAGTLPSLSELVGSGIQSAAGSLGIDLSGLTSATVGAGALAAVQAAIKIAGIAMDDRLSDEDKAIKAGEAAVTAVAAAAAPATFGASLAVLSIIDFIERLRAGQSWDKAIVGANDPTALLGITFPNSSEPGISGAISSPSMDWLMFAPHLAENFQKGGMAMNAMVEQLNYVQTKEQLGAVLNAYRAKVKEYTGWDWFGADTPDPYKLPPFPEAGGSSHEGGLTMSFGEPLAAIQNMVDQLLTILPGERITSLSYFDRGIPGQLQGAAYNQANPLAANGLRQETVATGFSGEMSTFGTEIVGNNYPVWSPDGSGGITATTYSNTDLMNALAAGTVTGPIFDPRQNTWGYVWAGTTAASLGIPDAASLLAPYYRNFGQSLAPQIGALQALTAPTVTGVNAVRPGPGDPGYMDWLMQNDPNAYAQILAGSFQTPDGGGFASGGWVTGGVPGRDSVPALLQPGEFVVPQGSARLLGARLHNMLGGGAAAEMGPSQVNYNVSIVINGNADDPEELVRVLAPRLRDELKRIDPRYSRAGNKTQV